ncbi:nitrilotriacetate monooxygenase [Nocardiopsis sp. NRRL B-16309]|nr:nitrilotriacetate monooxygenase [Nocardiopsis sp. NRRL B-16309]
MVLGAYLSYAAGHHAAAWRHPRAIADGASDIDHFVRLAATAERGLFDFVFLADTPSVFNDDSQGHGGRVVSLEPFTLLSALAMVTRDIGLIATASTTYTEPYNTARQLATMDHLSRGRAGWNLVTSSKVAAARNFGLDEHPDHAARYERANEYLDAVTALWDSWEDDALVRDKGSGIYYDPDKRHAPRFLGRHIRVEGELNVARPPQGHPVIVQAGSSEPGLDLAARGADLVFTAQSRMPDAVAFASGLRARTERVRPHARPPLILPGISPYTAATRKEALERYRSLESLIHPSHGVGMLGDMLGGLDLSGYDIDGPLPELPRSNGNQSRRRLIEAMARDEGLSIRELYLRLTVSRGHLTVIGDYDEVADAMTEWFRSGAADGFNVMPPVLPGDLDDFVDHVLPRLRERGVFKERYEPGTLRRKLGLPRPVAAHRGRDQSMITVPAEAG